MIHSHIFITAGGIRGECSGLITTYSVRNELYSATRYIKSDITCPVILLSLILWSCYTGGTNARLPPGYPLQEENLRPCSVECRANSSRCAKKKCLVETMVSGMNPFQVVHILYTIYLIVHM